MRQTSSLKLWLLSGVTLKGHIRQRLSQSTADFTLPILLLTHNPRSAQLSLRHEAFESKPPLHKHLAPAHPPFSFYRASSTYLFGRQCLRETINRTVLPTELVVAQSVALRSSDDVSVQVLCRPQSPRRAWRPRHHDACHDLTVPNLIGQASRAPFVHRAAA